MSEAAARPSEDIAYVRRLAESGASAPLIGGRFMAWWGLLVAGAWVAQHLAVNGMIGDGETIFAIIWGSFGILGLAGQIALSRSMTPKSGEGSAGNRASGVVWGAGALAIASMVIGAAVLASGPAGPAAFDWIAPVAFAVYASALIVTGALARERIATWAGYGAAAMVGLYTAFILDEDRYLIAAAGAAATVLLPGILLLLREPKAEG